MPNRVKNTHGRVPKLSCKESGDAAAKLLQWLVRLFLITLREPGCINSPGNISEIITAISR